jgi:hypothetical protein
MNMQHAGRLECRRSPWKLVGLLGLAAVMAGTSYFCTTLPELKAQIAGWVGLPFFGLAALGVLRMLAQSGPVVVIDAEGIHDRRWSVGVIRWEDVTRVWVASVSGNRMLCIEVSNPEDYQARMRRWERR